MERLRPFMFDGGTAEGTRAQRLRELEELDEIRDASRMCALHFFAEAAWNEEVHCPVLRLALKSYGSVVYRNVYGHRMLYLVQRLILSSTTARVLPSLVPRHGSGDILQSKIVDYTINLQPDDEMKHLIAGLLRSQPYALQTINQTMQGPVRYLPIAISIETNTPGESEEDAMIQLAMWAAAHFNRLRMLSRENTVSLTLPLLYVRGAEWFLRFACDRDRHTVCYFLISCLTGSHILAGTAWGSSSWKYENCGRLLQAARFPSLSRRMGDDHLQRMAGTEGAPTQRCVMQCEGKLELGGA
jgi:hypothetical protein